MIKVLCAACLRKKLRPGQPEWYLSSETGTLYFESTMPQKNNKVKPGLRVIVWFQIHIVTIQVVGCNTEKH
jgi:hypothetical protein